MNFREAKKEDIESILEVISHAKEYMKRNNSTQWNENYPNKETIINDIENNIGYVLIVKNLIRGYIVVDFSDDEVYKNIKENGKLLVITLLFIDVLYIKS